MTHITPQPRAGTVPSLDLGLYATPPSQGHCAGEGRQLSSLAIQNLGSSDSFLKTTKTLGCLRQR